MPLNVEIIRKQFPILSQTIDGHPLAYLDSAATAQKPRFVLDRMQKFYEEENANVHRGMHVLAERSTVAYEAARKAVQHFIGAAAPDEIVFTKSCTEAINLVARSFVSSHLREGDVVVLSLLEHHSNVVPWMQSVDHLGLYLKWIDIDDRGSLRIELFDEFLREGNVKLVSITAQSNVLGVRPDLKSIIDAAHAYGAKVLVDSAQAIAHHPTDVRELDCDFLVFSGHKLYGPTGIGVLYGKRDLLQSMPPFLGGGMMIQEVRQERFTPADLPQKFEAGTPPVAEAVGLAAAIEWLSSFPWKDIERHESDVLRAAFTSLSSIPGISVLGPAHADGISGCFSFVVDGIHPHDLTEILGRRGVCLRAGHHCTQPLHNRLGVGASTRLSVGIYNTVAEVRSAATAIAEAVQFLQR